MHLSLLGKRQHTVCCYFIKMLYNCFVRFSATSCDEYAKLHMWNHTRSPLNTFYWMKTRDLSLQSLNCRSNWHMLRFSTDKRYIYTAEWLWKDIWKCWKVDESPQVLLMLRGCLEDVSVMDAHVWVCVCMCICAYMWVLRNPLVANVMVWDQEMSVLYMCVCNGFQH